MKNLQKFWQLAVPKKSVQFFSCFTGKCCLYKISCVYRKQDFFLFLLGAGLRPDVVKVK
jgi:hypothetical protein